MIVDGFECEPLPAGIDLSNLPDGKILAGVVDGRLLWQGSAPTECLVLVTMPSSVEPFYHVGEAQRTDYERNVDKLYSPAWHDNALLLRLTVKEDEILAALYAFDAQYQVATTDQHGFRVRPASKGGIREVFFLAGAEWYKRRIEAQLARQPDDTADPTDGRRTSASDRTGE